MDFDSMSLEEITDYGASRLGLDHDEDHYGEALYELNRRVIIRDAILDMAEALDAEGLVVVPREATKPIIAVMRSCQYGPLLTPAQAWQAMIEAAPLMGVE